MATKLWCNECYMQAVADIGQAKPKLMHWLNEDKGLNSVTNTLRLDSNFI